MKKVLNKRITAVLLAALLIFVCGTFALAYTLPISPGDLYEGACPVCGGYEATIVDIPYQPTCTSGVTAIVACNTMTGTMADVFIPALGHNYTLEGGTDATCTEAGSKTYVYSRCGDTYTQTENALGHYYIPKVISEATCEEEGLTRYTCSRCGKSYDRTVEALGHEIEYEEQAATCLEDGYKNGTCTRCGQEFNETYPALGHDLGPFSVTKEATCTEDGKREAVCKRCGDTVTETIQAAGHKYGEWTVERAPTFFSEGLEVQTCGVCGDRIERAIPRKNIVPLILILLGILAALGSAVWAMLRHGLLKKILRQFHRPAIEKRSLVIASADEDLVKVLKQRRFLKVTECAREALEKTAEEEKPDLVIYAAMQEEDLPPLKQKAGKTSDADGTAVQEKDGEGPAIGLLVAPEILGRLRGTLDELKESGTIIGYTETGSQPAAVLTRLVLPVLKPSFRSEDTLENLSLLAEVLGFPGAARAVEMYAAGKEIRETLEEDELGAEGTSTVISDIAEILGLDTVAAVSGLLGKLSDVRAALGKEAGAYEKAEGAEAAGEIAETIRDLADL